MLRWVSFARVFLRQLPSGVSQHLNYLIWVRPLAFGCVRSIWTTQKIGVPRCTKISKPGDQTIFLSVDHSSLIYCIILTQLVSCGRLVAIVWLPKVGYHGTKIDSKWPFVSKWWKRGVHLTCKRDLPLFCAIAVYANSSWCRLVTQRVFLRNTGSLFTLPRHNSLDFRPVTGTTGYVAWYRIAGVLCAPRYAWCADKKNESKHVKQGSLCFSTSSKNKPFKRLIAFQGHWRRRSKALYALLSFAVEQQVYQFILRFQKSASIFRVAKTPFFWKFSCVFTGSLGSFYSSQNGSLLLRFLSLAFDSTNFRGVKI